MLSALMFTVATQVAQAADYTRVGVRAGDTADYSVIGMRSMLTAGTIKAHVEVVSVVGTTITARFTAYDSSGMVLGTPSLGSGDISTSSGFSYFAGFLICAGLTVGDEICKDSVGWAITSSIDMSVAGATRTLNAYYYSSADLYYQWDRETGILTELLNPASEPYGGRIYLTATSLWSGISTILIVVIVVAVVAVVVVLVVVLKLRKPKPTPVAVQSRGT